MALQRPSRIPQQWLDLRCISEPQPEVRAVLLAVPRLPPRSAPHWGRGCQRGEGLLPPRMGLGDSGERAWCHWGRDGSGRSQQLPPAGNSEVTETKLHQGLSKT